MLELNLLHYSQALTGSRNGMDDELLPFSLMVSDGGIKTLPLAIRHGALDRSSLICIAPSRGFAKRSVGMATLGPSAEKAKGKN
jgi:hypothetical protein